MDKRVHQLRVYQQALESAIGVYELTRAFPKIEQFSMVDQMRRASRSVCANLAESCYKQIYRGAFVAKLSDAMGEAAEMQTWFAIARRCGYVEADVARRFDDEYDHILAQLVRMIQTADSWLIKPKQ